MTTNWTPRSFVDDYERCSLTKAGEAFTAGFEGEIFIVLRQKGPTEKEAQNAGTPPPGTELVTSDVIMVTATSFSQEQTRRFHQGGDERMAVLEEVHSTCREWFVLTADGRLIYCERSEGPDRVIEGRSEHLGRAKLAASRPLANAVRLAVAVAMDLWPAWYAEGKRIGVVSAAEQVAAQKTKAAMDDLAREGVAVVQPADGAEA